MLSKHPVERRKSLQTAGIGRADEEAIYKLFEWVRNTGPPFYKSVYPYSRKIPDPDMDESVYRLKETFDQ